MKQLAAKSSSSLVQITFAVLAGFVLVLIFYHGGSLIPCIVFHSVNNALGAFEVEADTDPKMQIVLNVAFFVVVLGGYLLYLVKAFPKKSE